MPVPGSRLRRVLLSSPVLRCVLGGLAGVALAAAVSLAAPGDELWNTRWSRPGADQPVLATAEFAGQLVIGGQFDYVGSIPAHRVAAWNGISWTSMGPGFNGDVNALVVFNGELYAGGSFTASGPTVLHGLARWNGSAWVDVGGGADGNVEALAVYNSTLIVGGSFNQVGPSTLAGHIAAWNGTTWNTLGGGITAGDIVYDVDVLGTSLYATGYFEEAGGVTAANIARWSGSAWSALGAGLTDASGDPLNAEGRQLRVWSSRIVVTGAFEKAGGVARPNFATWSGTAWGTLGANASFFSAGAGALGEFGGNLVVTDGQGLPNTWRWTGSSWSPIVTGPFVFAMGNYGTSLVAVGHFAQVGSVQAEKVARWDGTQWFALGRGDGASPGVQRFFEWNGQLVTGLAGNDRFGPVYGTTVAGWNGTQWSGFGTGIPGGFGVTVNSFADLGGGVLAVGGAFSQAGGVAVNKLAQWNGAAWSALGGANTTVQAMKVMRGNLYAYGTVGLQTGIVRWNGTTWVSVATTNDIVWDLEEYGGKLVAAGSFTTIGGASIRGLAAWDSLTNTWSAFGTGVQNNGVFALEVDGTNLYVGGTFTSIGGAPANRVAVWNGSAWSALGGGVGNRVFDLKRYRGELFATGEFTTAEGSPANFVARWNGTAWSAMGSGLNARGFTLAVYRDTLFVGGDFTTAGGKYAVGLSSWAPAGAVGAEAPAPRAVLELRAAPTPFAGSTTLHWSLPHASHVRAQVFDLAGRVLATLHDGALPAGAHARAWDGRDADGRTVPPGVYLVRVTAGDRVEHGRVVRLR